MLTNQDPQKQTEESRNQSKKAADNKKQVKIHQSEKHVEYEDFLAGSAGGPAIEQP